MTSILVDYYLYHVRISMYGDKHMSVSIGTSNIVNIDTVVDCMYIQLTVGTNSRIAVDVEVDSIDEHAIGSQRYRSLPGVSLDF